MTHARRCVSPLLAEACTHFSVRNARFRCNLLAKCEHPFVMGHCFGPRPCFAVVLPQSSSTATLATKSMSESKTLRLLLAIMLNPDAKQKMGEVIAKLRAEHEHSDKFVKWVAPSLMHITLKFLGDVDVDGCEIIRKQLPTAVASHTGRFSLQFSKTGVFGCTHRPNIFYVGTQEDQTRKQFTDLAERVDSACNRAGFELERRAKTPHITLARTRRKLSKKQLNDLASLSESFLDYQFETPFDVAMERVALVQSTLSSEGAQYESLDEWSLNLC